MQTDKTAHMLDSFDKKFTSKKIKTNDLCRLYYNLPEILEKHPELISKTFDLLGKTVKDGKNDYLCIENLYTGLAKSVTHNPKLAVNSLDIFKFALLLKENNAHTFTAAQETFSAITKADPLLAPAAAMFTINAINSYENKISPKAPIKKFLRQVAAKNTDEHEKAVLNKIKANILQQIDTAGLLNAYMYQCILAKQKL